MTLVYDKGNNSQTNQAAVNASRYGFVGSLKANQVPDLLETSMPRSRNLVICGRIARRVPFWGSSGPVW